MGCAKLVVAAKRHNSSPRQEPATSARSATWRRRPPTPQCRPQMTLMATKFMVAHLRPAAERTQIADWKSANYGERPLYATCCCDVWDLVEWKKLQMKRNFPGRRIGSSERREIGASGLSTSWADCLSQVCARVSHVCTQLLEELHREPSASGKPTTQPQCWPVKE